MSLAIGVVLSRCAGRTVLVAAFLLIQSGGLLFHQSVYLRMLGWRGSMEGS